MTRHIVAILYCALAFFPYSRTVAQTTTTDTVKKTTKKASKKVSDTATDATSATADGTKKAASETTDAVKKTTSSATDGVKKATSTRATTASASDIEAAKASGKVWVNTDSGVYHKSGQWYGATKQGKFMSEQDALKAGYRAAK